MAEDVTPLGVNDATFAHIELARQGYAAFAAGDAIALRALLADDIEWHVHGHRPAGAVYRGADEVMGHLATLLERLSGDYELDIREIIGVAGPDAVVVVLARRHAGRGGLVADAEEAHVLRYAQGRVWRFDAYVTDAAALDALLR